MNSRTLIASIAFATGAMSLTGCAVGASPTAPTVTVTAAVATAAKATPEPTIVPQSANDALSPFDAWLLCYGATYGVFGVPDDGYWEVQPYDETAGLGDPTVADNGDGTFQVRLVLLPSARDGNGAEAICDAGGTIGDPSVAVSFGPGFG